MKNRSMIKLQIIFFSISILLIISLSVTSQFREIDNYLRDGKIFFHQNVMTQENSSSDNIVLVNIDEETLKKYPLPHSYHLYSKLINKAKSLEVSSVVLMIPFTNDVLTGNPSVLADTFKGKVSVILPYTLQEALDGSGKRKTVLPPETLLKSASHSGLLYRETEWDGTVRWTNLAVNHDNKIIPSIEAVLAAQMTDMPEYRLNISNNTVEIGHRKISTDSQFRTVFIPLKEERIESYSLAELLESGNMKHLKGKTLIAGFTWGEFAVNYKNPIPFNPPISQLQLTAASVVSIADNSLVKPVSPFVNYLVLSFASLFLAAYLWSIESRRMALACFVFIALLITVNTAVFFIGYDISLAPVIASAPFLAAFLVMQRNKMAQKSIKQFVPTPYLNTLQKEGGAGTLSPEVKNVTVLFSDIKGYTTLAERYGPNVVMELLDEYIKSMNKIVEENGGMIINYQGDGLLAVFGFSDAGNSNKHAYQGVKSAMLMQDAIKAMRRQWRMEYRELFVVGIGIATGNVAFGSIGSDSYRQFTAIGDTVNLAARLQSLGKEMRTPILISDEAYKNCRKQISASIINATYLKGKFNICPIYEVHGYKNRAPRTNAGILANDDRETVINKKIQFYREIQETLEY